MRPAAKQGRPRSRRKTQFSSQRSIRFLLENAGGAQAGAADLLLNLADNGRGLACLRLALSGSIPAAPEEAAAACAIIGTEETKRILNEALHNSHERIQHMAACALAAFPVPDALQTARQWFNRNDGIKEPLGAELTVLGRTALVFTFKEVSHVNMSGGGETDPPAVEIATSN